MPSNQIAARTTPDFKDKLRTETALLPSGSPLIDQIHAARAATQGRDFVQAGMLYRQILEMEPENLDGLHGLGTTLLQQGKAADAVVFLQKAVESGKVPAQFYVNYAVALEASGQVSKALKVLKRGVSQDRKDPFLHQSLGVFLYNRSREREALRSLLKAAQIDPELPRLQLMLGDIYLKHQDEKKALECYNRHLSQAPDDYRVTSRVAYLLGRFGKHQEVLDLLMPLYSEDTQDSDLCNNIGSALILLERLDEAEPYILQAYELDPSRWEFNANVAGLHLANERIDAAVTLFQNLKEQYPDNPQPATDLALAYMRQGEVEKAEKEIEEITQAHPDHDPAWVALGILHTSNVKYLAAAEAYRSALEANPINVHANSNLAIVMKSLNDLDEAAFHARKTIHVPTYSPAFFANVFQVFHAACDYEGIAELGDLRELVDHVPAGSLPGCVFDLMVHAGDAPSARWVASVNRRWGELLEESAARNPLPPMPKRAKHEKVRVGFLSSDLRDHSVGKHIAPLLQHFDHDRLEVYGYSAWDVGEDKVHQALSQLMNGELRTVANLPARAVAEIIRGDEIDILFELNGHTLGSRLDVIPYRGAPVQIEWLGFPFTTGLKDLDYFLLDDHVAPEDPVTDDREAADDAGKLDHIRRLRRDADHRQAAVRGEWLHHLRNTQRTLQTDPGNGRRLGGGDAAGRKLAHDDRTG